MEKLGKPKLWTYLLGSVILSGAVSAASLEDSQPKYQTSPQ